ncbi:hypothetical protein ACOMHN_065736 [Nucella lapillus]
MLCNGYNNCGDWEDESHCPTPRAVTSPPVTLPACGPDQIQCNSTGLCITPQVLCDGYNNCGDGEDERQCSDTLAPSGCGDFSVQKGSHNVISTMDYPYHNYTNNADCFWIIEVPSGQNILFEFEPLFEVEGNSTDQCQPDYVVIYQTYIYSIVGTFCGHAVPSPILVKSHHALVRFFSDHTHTGRGFGIRWSAVPSTDTPPTPPVTTTTTATTAPTASPTTTLQRCGGLTVGQGHSGVLQSPGYSLTSYPPAHYPPSAHCGWRIVSPPHTTIRLHFEDLMLETSPNCSSDSLTVYDGGDETGPELGRFCGKYTPPDVVSTDSLLFLRFSSDAGVEGRGFKVTWTAHNYTVTPSHTTQTTPSPGYGCDGTAPPLTSPSGVVTSPGYDGVNAYAGKLDCQWLITVAPGNVIELKFVSFDLEWTRGCSYDFVLIYDGSEYGKVLASLCGDRPPPELTSTSHSLLVKFHSDDETGGYGFNLTYTSHPAGPKCTASQFSCPGGRCVNYEQVCDGRPDCPGGGDEIICPNRGDCGRPAIAPQLAESRIVGGGEAVEGSWPWQASLRLSGKHQCGGTLIDAHWVLTATHCFNSNWRTEDWTVMLGQHELRTSDRHHQLFNVTDIILRQDYNDITSDNDVALMKLARPVTFTPYVQTACLASIVLPPGETCYITGFGETLGKLKQAAVPLIDRATCNQPDWYRQQVFPNMFCAGYERGGVDACGGDSGGPLVCQTGQLWVLYGITSWGVSCAAVKQPGVYMRVTDYVRWIQETVAKHS